MKKGFVLKGLLFIIIIAFGFYVRKKSGLEFEYSMMKSFQNVPNIVTSFFRLFTTLGNSNAYIFWLALLFYICAGFKREDIFFTVLVALILSLITFSLLKIGFQRIRPIEFFKIREIGFSYPSGHATISTAFFYTCFVYLKSSLKRNKERAYLLLLIPFFISISRLFMGVHWPTDVLMGMILGYIISKVTIKKIFTRGLR